MEKVWETVKEYWIKSFRWYTTSDSNKGLIIICCVMAVFGLMGWKFAIPAIIVFSIWYWVGNYLNNKSF